MLSSSMSSIKKIYKEFCSLEQKGIDPARAEELIFQFFSVFAKIEDRNNIELKGFKILRFNEECEHFLESGYVDIVKKLSESVLQTLIVIFSNNGIERKAQQQIRDTLYMFMQCLMDGHRKDYDVRFIVDIIENEISMTNKEKIEVKGLISDVKLFAYLVGLTKEEFDLWIEPLSKIAEKQIFSLIPLQSILFFTKAAENDFNLFANPDVAKNFLIQISKLKQKLGDKFEFVQLKTILLTFCKQIKQDDEVLIESLPLFFVLLESAGSNEEIQTLTFIRKLFQKFSLKSNVIKGGYDACSSSIKTNSKNINLFTIEIMFCLMFLFDTSLNIIEIWKELAEYQSDLKDLFTRFSIYVAIVTFFDLFEIDVEEVKKVASASTDKKAIKNTMGKNIAYFMSNIDSIIDSPWNFANNIKSIIGFDNMSEIESYAYMKFDDLGNKYRFKLDDLKTPFGYHFPYMYSVLVLTYFDLSRSVSPKVKIGNPDCLIKYFLGDGLKILSKFKKTDDILLAFNVVSYMFSDVTLRKKLSNEVFAKWDEIVAVYLFCDDHKFRKKAFDSLCNAIEVMHPGCGLLIPLFANYVNIYYIENDVENYEEFNEEVQKIVTVFSSSCTISKKRNSCYSFDLIHYLKKKMKKNSKAFDPKVTLINIGSNEILNNYVDFFDKFFYSLNNTTLKICFSSILRCFVETGEKCMLDTLSTMLRNKFLPEYIVDLYSLLQFAKRFKDLYPSLLKDLVESNNSQLIDVALEFFISTCNYVDYQKDDFPKKFCEKATKEQLIRFLAEYKRYPFSNGINFQQSSYDIFSINPTPFSFVSSRGDLILCSQTKEDEGDVTVLTDVGNSSFNVKNLAFEKPHLLNTPSKFTRVMDTVETNYEPLLLENFEIKEKVEDLQNEEQIKISTEYHQQEQKNDFPIPAVLHQLGLFDKNSKSLNLDQQSYRGAKALLNSTFRYQHKIALLYVSKGQRDQQQILGNSSFSPEFSSFMEKLGYVIDMRTHCCSVGGLDNKAFSTGYISLFYADSNHEVTFHVPSLLTDSKNDEQFIYKKRHIGNDSVHIIWTEDSEVYKVVTIISHFNHAHIIIYPLGDGMYSVQVHHKQDVPWFGPLREKSIVSEDSLVGLVRYTAIMADHQINLKKQEETIKATHEHSVKLSVNIFDQNQSPILSALEFSAKMKNDILTSGTK